MVAGTADRSSAGAARIADRRARMGLPPEMDLGVGMQMILAQPWVSEPLRQRVLAAYAEAIALLAANRVNGTAYSRWRRLLVRAATPPGVRINREEIAERDRWRCGFCGGKVVRVISPGWAHPLSASLDHIQPLAAGGLHTPDNVRLAHNACNSADMALSAVRRRSRARVWSLLAGQMRTVRRSSPGSASQRI